MKTSLVLRLRLACVAAFSFLPLSAQLVTWNFTGENNVATSSADFVASNLDADSGLNLLTRGAAALASTGANSFRTTGFSNNGISTANLDYFQFSVSAAAGHQLSLTGISAWVAGTASYAVSPGVSMQFAYSLDGTNFTLIGSPSVVTSTPSFLSAISLNGISALQNMDAATTAYFRFYASGQTTTGGWGFNSPNAGTDGLSLSGNLTAVPEPAASAATWGAAALLATLWQRRRARAHSV